MIRIGLAALMALAASAPAFAQDDGPTPTPAQAQVRARMATAVLDLCLPVVEGADMATSPALAALGSAEVETADYDPEVRTLVTDDGVHVLRASARSCSAQYLPPETAPAAGEDEEPEIGAALNTLIARLDAEGSGWTAQPGDWGEMPPYLSDDHRLRMELSLQTDIAGVSRLLNDPETVRAYYARTARAEARSGPEAILASAPLCAAYTVTDTGGPEAGTEAWEKAGELPEYLIDGAPVGRGTDAAALRGHLDAWLTPGEGSCAIQANAQPDVPDGDLDTLRSGVLSLLSAANSGWTAAGTGAWTHTDGTRLTLGEGDAETQTWTITPAT